MQPSIKLTILIGSLFLFAGKSFAQTGSDTTKTSDTSKIQQVSNKVDELIQRIQNAETDKKEQVGVISFSDTIPVHLYVKDPNTHKMKKTGRMITVERVSLLLKDGYAVEILVFSGRRKFTNTKAPVTISTRRFMQTEYLLNVKNLDESVLLKEVLSYDAFNSFFPDDGHVWLTHSQPSDTLAKNIGVNSVFDLRLYTDALGTFGNTPNGILQTDAHVKQFLHRLNVANTGLFLGQYFKFNFNASKFNQGQNFEDSSHFSRSGLMQKAFINAEFAYNILNVWVEKKSISIFYWDIGGGISVTNLAGLKDTGNVTTQNLFSEIGVNLQSSSNIGLNLYGRTTLQYSPQTPFESQGNALWFLRFGGEVFWNPFGDQANRIFSRVNYTFSTKHSEKQHQFFQFQFGYSVLLSKLIGKSGS